MIILLGGMDISQDLAYVRDNIVMIVDENKAYHGSAFFVEIKDKKYCLTAHDNILRLEKIFIQYEEEIYSATWIQRYSASDKNIAVLEVKNCPAKPLRHNVQNLPPLPVHVFGFSASKLKNFPRGLSSLNNKLSDITFNFHLDREENGGPNEWNKSPEVNVDVFVINAQLDLGFEGSPVVYTEDNNVVGMVIGRSEIAVYMIPIQTILQKFNAEPTQVSETTPGVKKDEQNMGVQMVLVTGSSKIRRNYKEISNLAKLIGSRIMDEQNWILLNGGASETSSGGDIISVDHLACIGAKEKLEKSGDLKSEKIRILTLIPQPDSRDHHAIGKIEIEGTTPRDRRFNLVKKADVIIAIEGSIGTQEIINLGIELKKPTLPICCTGGKSEKTWNHNEDSFLEKFNLKKTSEEYKLLTINGLNEPKELTELVIQLAKVKVIQDREVRSWHDTPMHADNPSTDDLLGRKPFAKAIAGGMRYYQKNAGFTGAFLVHLYGSWGSGKTTLLEFLKEELDPDFVKSKRAQWFNRSNNSNDRSTTDCPWIIVSFNAWRQQRVRPPWWALMDGVYMQIRRKSRFPFSWAIWIKENCWRIWNSWSRAFWIAALSFLFIAVAIFLGLIPLESIHKAAQSGGMDLLAFFSNKVVSGLMASIVSIIAGIRAFGNSLLPSSPSAATQFQLKTSDPMDKLQRHFQKMISWTRKKPVAIFIDDLDRCSEDYTIELLEGIQTIFRDAKYLTFVIAADRKWLYSCYQKVYETFSETFNDIGRPLGYLFLDKTFQISVPVPKLSGHYRDAYLHYLVTLDKEFENNKEKAKKRAEREIIDMNSSNLDRKLKANLGTKIETESQVVEDQAFREVIVEQIFTRPEFKEKTENFLSKFSSFMEPNPRSMKRLVTAFGIWRARDILSGSYIEEDKLAQWVIISQRWPLMATLLEEHPEIVDIIKGKEKQKWGEILEEKGFNESTRQMLLDPAISDVILGSVVGKPLDSEAIRQLSSL